MESASGQIDVFTRFFGTGRSVVEEIPAEALWLGLRPEASIYDGVAPGPNEAGSSEASRQAYLSNRVAAVLMAMAAELLVPTPGLQRDGAGAPERQEESTFDL
jgi:hypothetical protein